MYPQVDPRYQNAFLGMQGAYVMPGQPLSVDQAVDQSAGKMGLMPMGGVGALERPAPALGGRSAGVGLSANGGASPGDYTRTGGAQGQPQVDTNLMMSIAKNLAKNSNTGGMSATNATAGADVGGLGGLDLSSAMKGYTPTTETGAVNGMGGGATDLSLMGDAAGTGSGTGTSWLSNLFGGGGSSSGASAGGGLATGIAGGLVVDTGISVLSQMFGGKDRGTIGPALERLMGFGDMVGGSDKQVAWEKQQSDTWKNMTPEQKAARLNMDIGQNYGGAQYKASDIAPYLQPNGDIDWAGMTRGMQARLTPEERAAQQAAQEADAANAGTRNG